MEEAMIQVKNMSGGMSQQKALRDASGKWYTPNGTPLNINGGTISEMAWNGALQTTTSGAKDVAALERQRADIKLAEEAKMKAEGLNPDGSPVRPGFTGITNADNLLEDKYKLIGQADVTADQAAYNAIKTRAMSQGPSAWANMMTDKQALEQTGQMDQSRNQSAGAQAQTLSALMMRGGLQGGSRERIAKSTLRDQMMGAQQVNRQGMMDRANIGVQDEATKTDMLKQTSALDFQNANLGLANRDYRTGIDRTNLSNTLAGLDAGNKNNMDVYSERMKKWAAGKQADAMKASSGGGKK